MKKLSFISIITMICFACNSNSTSNNATENPNMNDSAINKEEIAPPPGLGSDPTRNDASRENPIGGSSAVDSSIHKSDAGATPGLGSDPTRNDASKDRSKGAGPSNKDSGQKKN